jgi:hypothetical protein
MFAQIRTISTNYYTNWVGFEDGAMLGYYQPGTLIPDHYSVIYMLNGNSSCPYNYTHSNWEAALNITNSENAPPPVRDPYNIARENESGNQMVPKHCLETFVARKNDGGLGVSFDGGPYDCRYRPWFFDMKAKAKNIKGKSWTGMFIDVPAYEPAFAFCAPLMNLTAYAPYKGLKADSGGFIGATCFGLYIEAISSQVGACLKSLISNSPVQPQSPLTFITPLHFFVLPFFNTHAALWSRQ